MLISKLFPLPPLLLLGIAGCTEGSAPEDMAARRMTMALPETTVGSQALPESGRQSGTLNEQLYQKARAATIERRRAENAELVRSLALPGQESDSVFAALEEQLQAKMQIADYMRDYPQMTAADLDEKSRQPGNGHLAELIRKASPKATQAQIGSTLGEKQLNHYMELKSAKRRAN
jgi:hypothetical protein